MEGVDLSSWKIALNGAEPVRADTIRQFQRDIRAPWLRSERSFPAYGMAEATLLISGGRRGAGHVTRTVSRAALQAHIVGAPADDADAQILVGCGRALPDERIAIVDPETPRRLPPDRVGEIWVNGPNVARAYWRNAGGHARPACTRRHRRRRRRRELAAHRRPRLSRREPANCSSPAGSRTSSSSAASTTIRRTSSAPCSALHPALRQNGGAVFSVPDERGEETLVVVQEIERTARNSIDPDEITGLIREGVTDQHELFARHIVLIRPGTLPKTTSGKIQRSLARRLWLERRSRGSRRRKPIDQKSIFAASPSRMLSAIPCLHLARDLRAIVNEVDEVGADRASAHCRRGS